MIPVIAIVGRPNVGKSTLFNRLTKSRAALVADFPGLTRDRQYGYGTHDDKSFIVIDTGGLGEEKDELSILTAEQSVMAIEEANIILFLVDAQEGLTVADELIAKRLRTYNKPYFLVVNKIDVVGSEAAADEFYALGVKQIIQIAAAHNRGIDVLLEQVLAACPQRRIEAKEEEESEFGIKMAVVGRPNVGKSTLVNRILGEKRVTVFDQPGTTRDSIFISLEKYGKKYTLIDTAGVRRRRRVKDVIEKFSIIKTLQAIEISHVVVFLIDGQEGITDQDLRLLGFILEAGKALIIAVNKWDGLSLDEKKLIKKELDRRLVFVDYAERHFISALHGSGVGNLFESVEKAYESATRELSTPQLTKILEKAVEAYQPPLAGKYRIKLRYAHAGGRNPPLIVIHGTRLKSLPRSYLRYLENTYRKALKLVGTPIRIELKSASKSGKSKT